MSHKNSVCFGKVARGVRHARILAIVLSVGAIIAPSFTYAANNDPFRSGREAINPKQSVSAGQSSGGMTYTYPLTIPPGRNGMQPNLSLNYSSNDKRQDSLFGYGWSIGIPYIERVNKIGTNNLYNQDRDHTFFTSTLSGELLPILNSTPVGGSFLGTSQSTDLLAEYATTGESIPQYDELTIESGGTPSEMFADRSLPPREQDAVVDADFMKVREDVARSFHTFADTFLPMFSYHAKEEEQWNIDRKRTAIDARAPIRGFPVSNTRQRVFNGVSSDIAGRVPSLSPSLRATTKGEAIASVGNLSRTNRPDLSLEVLSMNPIDDGVEVFARAWDKHDRSIGFGKDGTVEIERFRIINPPILVEDPKGDIVQEWTDDLTQEVHHRTLREDPREALLQVLEQTIAIKSERFGPERIIPGKVGRTTTIVYPNAHTETTSVDGSVWGVGSAGGSWSALRNASDGYQADDTSVTTRAMSLYYQPTQQFEIWWQFQLFDTASIPDGDTVASATLSFYRYNSGDSNDYSATNATYKYLTCVGSTPASNTALATADFDQVGSTKLCASDVPVTSGTVPSVSAYTNMSLNASGVAAIAKTGVTKLAIVNGYDFDNQSIGTDAIRGSGVLMYNADQAGTTNDPKLTIEHSGGGGSAPQAPSDLQVESLTNPTNVATSNPRFSAIHKNASTTALATSYQIQISTSTIFTSSLYWDSGKKTLSSSTPREQRSPQIYSTTTFSVNGTQYYWRIRFWDQTNTVGEWSTSTDSFITQITGDYMARVDNGSMMKYTLGSDGTWIAFDKKGWKYTFGAVSTSRISDPSASSKIYRWYLDEISDPNGNRILYRYTKDGGQVYPDYIDYSDHGAGDSLYEIDFVRCSEDGHYTCLTSYVATSSMYGFPTQTRDRIGDISVKVNYNVVRRYTPSYTSGENASRALLASIQETGGFSSDTGTKATDAIVYPPTNYRYLTSTTTWTQVVRSPNFRHKTCNYSLE